ncbi:putative reverse transcriptase domain-containing protein [Tanacetum coccineum]
MTITRSGMTPEAIEELVNRRVEEALAAHEATRAANALETENQSQNGSDGDNGNGGNGNGRNENPDENAIEGDNGDGNENRNVNGRGDRPGARECTYQDFMKCQPLSFKGTEGVVCLIRWSEKIETVFHISNCPERYQVKELLELMTEVYCLRNEIQKMETELWNLSVKNNDMDTYTQRTHKTTRCCSDCQQLDGSKVEGLCCKRRKEQEEIEQQLWKQPWVTTAPQMTEYWRAVIATTTQGTPGPNQRVITCFECGAQGHYRKDCPKVKNQNRGNKSRVPEVKGKAYILGGGDANPGSNTVTGTFLLNDHHAYMLFDSGVDRSFVSNTFSALLDIIPYALDVSYAVELADGRTSETNTILRGCTLGLLGHPFNIDLIPIDLVRIPYGNEIWIVQGGKNDKVNEFTLSDLLSCEKGPEVYGRTGCHNFLANVIVVDYRKQKDGKIVMSVK